MTEAQIIIEANTEKKTKTNKLFIKSETFCLLTLLIVSHQCSQIANCCVLATAFSCTSGIKSVQAFHTYHLK